MLLSVHFINYEKGFYMGQMAKGLPHGTGILYFTKNKKFQSIIYIGNFNQGSEDGFGVHYYPADGSSHIGMYSKGAPVHDTPYFMRYEDVLTHLKDHLYILALFVNAVKGDLEVEKDTVEQVNIALTSSKDKFDALFDLARNAGVDNNALYAIKNRK